MVEVSVEWNTDRVPPARRRAILEAPVFGESFTDHMVTMTYTDRGWGTMRLQPFADLSLSPAALALHYGQSIFEALKAYALPSGEVGLFRPDVNARRMNASASRIAMPDLPDGAFELACALLAEADRAWVPPQNGAALYVRPFMFASEPHLSVRPATEYTFAVIASPVASYFGDRPGAITVSVESHDVRATPGGTGAAKFAGNYAAGFAAHGRAEAAGHDQVMWLDAAEHRWVEELNAMNVMFVWRRDEAPVLTTPPLSGTILEGVTRETLLELARADHAGAGAVGPEHAGAGNGSAFGAVLQEPTSIEQIVAGCADGTLLEAFACGTAAVIAPIGTFVLAGEPLVVGDGGPGASTMSLREALLDLQYGRVADSRGWLRTTTSILESHSVQL